MAPEMLDEFRGRYSPRPPRLPSSFSESELRKLTEVDGLRVLDHAPAPEDILLGMPPRSRTANGRNRYLWVIDSNGVPYIREMSIPALEGNTDNLPKHTNLTGGETAYVGGELWYRSCIDLYVSGGSGRYPPGDESQLDGAVGVFKGFGYDVTSLGWDEENRCARRYLPRCPE